MKLTSWHSESLNLTWLSFPFFLNLVGSLRHSLRHYGSWWSLGSVFVGAWAPGILLFVLLWILFLGIFLRVLLGILLGVFPGLFSTSATGGAVVSVPIALVAMTVVVMMSPAAGVTSLSLVTSRSASGTCMTAIFRLLSCWLSRNCLISLEFLLSYRSSNLCRLLLTWLQVIRVSIGCARLFLDLRLSRLLFLNIVVWRVISWPGPFRKDWLGSLDISDHSFNVSISPFVATATTKLPWDPLLLCATSLIVNIDPSSVHFAPIGPSQCI